MRQRDTQTQTLCGMMTRNKRKHLFGQQPESVSMICGGGLVTFQFLFGHMYNKDVTRIPVINFIVKVKRPETLSLHKHNSNDLNKICICAQITLVR